MRKTAILGLALTFAAPLAVAQDVPPFQPAPIVAPAHVGDDAAVAPASADSSFETALRDLAPPIAGSHPAPDYRELRRLVGDERLGNRDTVAPRAHEALLGRIAERVFTPLAVE